MILSEWGADVQSRNQEGSKRHAADSQLKWTFNLPSAFRSLTLVARSEKRDNEFQTRCTGGLSVGSFDCRYLRSSSTDVPGHINRQSILYVIETVRLLETSAQAIRQSPLPSVLPLASQWWITTPSLGAHKTQGRVMVSSRNDRGQSQNRT